MTRDWNESDGGVRKKYGNRAAFDNAGLVALYPICGIANLRKTYWALMHGPEEAGPMTASTPCPEKDE